jgi:prophage antirepressor-like protein
MTDQSATPSGVQDEVTETEKTPYIDPRMAAMDAISKQINGDPEADAPEPAVTTETDTQLAAQLSDEPKFLNDGLDQYRVKVKIDGQESDVSVADMQREYQKAGAADRRMADATRLQRENMELQERLQQQLQNIPAVPDVEDIDTANQYTTALFAGDEAEANKAFATAVKKAVQAAIGETGRSNTTQVDPVQIAQQVKQQMVADTALEQSRADYPQLYADPDIEALGATKIQRKMAEGKSFAEALTETGSEFAKSFNWTTAGRQTESATTTARDMKLDRKANIDNVRAINSKTTTNEAPPQSTTDVIAEMRKARGM